jgi:hypothetical protein
VLSWRKEPLVKLRHLVVSPNYLPLVFIAIDCEVRIPIYSTEEGHKKQKSGLRKQAVLATHCSLLCRAVCVVNRTYDVNLFNIATPLVKIVKCKTKPNGVIGTTALGVAESVTSWAYNVLHVFNAQNVRIARNKFCCASASNRIQRLTGVSSGLSSPEAISMLVVTESLAVVE